MNKKYIELGEMILIKPHNKDIVFCLSRSYHINFKNVKKVDVCYYYNNSKSLLNIIFNKDGFFIKLKDIIKMISKNVLGPAGKSYQPGSIENYILIMSIINNLIVKITLSEPEANGIEEMGFKLLMDYIPIDVILTGYDKVTDSPLYFKGNDVHGYFLEKEKSLYKITDKGDNFYIMSDDNVLKNGFEEIKLSFSPFRYKIILDLYDGIQYASLVLGDMNRVVSKISVSGFGMELALHSLMETYKYMYLIDLLKEIENESHK